jgi:hypothetical protein
VAYWSLHTLSDGESLVKALWGDVEDAIPTLLVIVIFGALAGAFVGIVYGLAARSLRER